MKKDKLSEILDINPLPEKIKETTKEDVVVTNQDAQDDYVLARQVLRKLLEKGEMAVDNMSDLAESSESARAYEVLSTLIKTVSETTKDLYDIHKKTKDLKDNPKEKIANPINVDKAVFVGTTSDLLKQVEKNENI